MRSQDEAPTTSVPILPSCSSMLPLCSHRDVEPGEAITVSIRSSYSEFPEVVYFGETFVYFEVDLISLRHWSLGRIVLQSRDLDDSIDSVSVIEALGRVIIPRSADIEIAVRNVDVASRPFASAIKSHSSVVERRAHLLCALRAQCEMNAHPSDPSLASWRLFHLMREGNERPSWWTESDQGLVDLPEEDAVRLDADLARCADGGSRRDLRVAAEW